MQVRNQQLSVMAGNYGFGRMMVNAGKSHSCGIETALRGQLLDGEGAKAIDYKGKYVPYVPQHTISAMADYRLDIAERGLHSIIFGANVNAQGKTYWNNTFAIDSSATGTTEYFAQRGNPFQCGIDLRFHF